jgi:hypothetical protein
VPSRTYSENEINDELQKWSVPFGDNFGLDHVTLRRYLVDEMYIKRDIAGKLYELGTSDLPYTFDQSKKELDLKELINEGMKEKELRKQQYAKGSSE